MVLFFPKTKLIVRKSDPEYEKSISDVDNTGRYSEHNDLNSANNELNPGHIKLNSENQDLNTGDQELNYGNQDLIFEPFSRFKYA